MKNYQLLAFVMMLLCSSLACSSRKMARFSSHDQGGLMETNEAVSSLGETKEKRKVLYSAWLTLAVAHPDSTNKQIEKITNQFDGYVNQMGTYRTVIRVKSDYLDKALVEIGQLGKVQSKNMEGIDVTEDYQDFQIRLDNAEKTRNRYLELLQKANTVDEILKVERELERLNETIDLLKSQINRIDHLESYSTITILLKERKKPGIIGYVGIGIYKAIKWLFVRN